MKEDIVSPPGGQKPGYDSSNKTSGATITLADNPTNHQPDKDVPKPDANQKVVDPMVNKVPKKEEPKAQDQQQKPEDNKGLKQEKSDHSRDNLKDHKTESEKQPKPKKSRGPVTIITTAIVICGALVALALINQLG